MKTLDYKTACMLAAYEYQITDGEGIYYISHPERTHFVIDSFENDNPDKHSGQIEIYYQDIGIKYWILARLFDDLHKKIYKDTMVNKFYRGKCNLIYSTIIDVSSGHIEARIYDYLLTNHFAINFTTAWWKPIKD